MESYNASSRNASLAWQTLTSVCDHLLPPILTLSPHSVMGVVIHLVSGGYGCP